MNKRGVIGIILFFVALFLIVIVGFIASVSVGVLDYASDEITPIMEDLGMAGETNMSEIAGYTFGTVDKLVQAMPWMIGLAYFMALIFSLVVVVGYSYNPHPAFMGFYFVLMILLIFGSVVMSNMYEDIYTGTDEIALRMQEQSLLAYMILFSPGILTFIAVIAGVLMFGRTPESVGVGI